MYHGIRKRWTIMAICNFLMLAIETLPTLEDSKDRWRQNSPLTTKARGSGYFSWGFLSHARGTRDPRQLRVNWMVQRPVGRALHPHLSAPGCDLGYIPRCVSVLGYIFPSHFSNSMCYEITFKEIPFLHNKLLLFVYVNVCIQEPDW